jgi:hypothetical protein
MIFRKAGGLDICLILAINLNSMKLSMRIGIRLIVFFSFAHALGLLITGLNLSAEQKCAAELSILKYFPKDALAQRRAFQPIAQVTGVTIPGGVHLVDSAAVVGACGQRGLFCSVTAVLEKIENDLFRKTGVVLQLSPEFLALNLLLRKSILAIVGIIPIPTPDTFGGAFPMNVWELISEYGALPEAAYKPEISLDAWSSRTEMFDELRATVRRFRADLHLKDGEIVEDRVASVNNQKWSAELLGVLSSYLGPHPSEYTVGTLKFYPKQLGLKVLTYSPIPNLVRPLSMYFAGDAELPGQRVSDLLQTVLLTLSKGRVVPIMTYISTLDNRPLWDVTKLKPVQADKVFLHSLVRHVGVVIGVRSFEGKVTHLVWNRGEISVEFFNRFGVAAFIPPDGDL